MPTDVVFLVGGIGVTPAAAAVRAITEAEPRPENRDRVISRLCDRNLSRNFGEKVDSRVNKGELGS